MLQDLPVWFAIPVLVIGGGFVVVGSAVFRRMREVRAVRARAVPVVGTVVGLRTERRADSDGGTRRVVVPTVRYSDPREDVREAEVDLPGALRLSEGDRVDLVLDPQRPDVVLPARGQETLVGVVGAVFALLGVVLVVGVVAALLLR